MAWPRWLDEEGGMVSMEASFNRPATPARNRHQAALADADAAQAAFARPCTLTADAARAA